MDELTAIQAFRPAPPPDQYTAERARRALRTTIRGSRRRWITRPRVLVAAAVLAVAGATAAAASGLADRVREVVAGEPAPAPVKRQFDLQNRRKAVVPWLERDRRSRVIASKAEGVLAIDTSVGPVYLWVAPTVGGGECHLLDIEALPRVGGAGGCSPLPVRLDHVPRPNVQGTRVGDRQLRLLHGRVAPDVASVEVRFKDGESRSIPTAKGFFLTELSRGEEPALLIARDERSQELGRFSMRRPLLSRRIPKPAGPYRTVIEIETSWGYPMSFAVAPGAGGTTCTQIRYRRAHGGGCNRQPDADEIWVGHSLWNETEDRKPVLVLQGSVGSAIERLELEYRDGGRVEVPVVEGHVLFELSRDRPPKQLVGFGADGSVVARRAFG